MDLGQRYEEQSYNSDQENLQTYKSFYFETSSYVYEIAVEK